METTSVVEGLEVVEKSDGSGVTSWEGLTVWEDLIFDGGKGAFSEGIVITITSSAHALEEAGTRDETADLGG